MSISKFIREKRAALLICMQLPPFIYCSVTVWLFSCHQIWIAHYTHKSKTLSQPDIFFYSPDPIQISLQNVAGFVKISLGQLLKSWGRFTYFWTDLAQHPVTELTGSGTLYDTICYLWGMTKTATALCPIWGKHEHGPWGCPSMNCPLGAGFWLPQTPCQACCHVLQTGMYVSRT